MPIIGSFGAGSKGGYGRGGAAPVDVNYLVVAGGGGNGSSYNSGGAGGYRTSFPGGTQITMNGGEVYPVTVGSTDTDSSFSTITSTKGGRANTSTTQTPGSGGSGAGKFGAPGTSGLPGNVGGYSPPEGNSGGVGCEPGAACVENSGGGGGAGGSGGNGSCAANPGGPGGAGGIGAGIPDTFVPNSYGTPGPSPTLRYFAGGGAGYSHGTCGNPSGTNPPSVGGGGRGRYENVCSCGNPGGSPVSATPGTVNTGGGVGGQGPGTGGGSGIVVINAPSSANFTVTPGTNTVATAPDGNKVAIFTVSGTIVNK
jgi:hypothetical protein